MTIKDIAKESGYSVSTVSRVLNNRDDVSPEAEKKIRQIVAEHNFVPNGIPFIATVLPAVGTVPLAVRPCPPH